MKIARFFAVIFGCIGIVLLIGSMAFFLWNQDASARIVNLPQQAVSCSDAFAQALNAGDLEAAAQLMYGQPDLGVSQVPGDPETALLWESFCKTMTFEYSGKCYVEHTDLVQKGSITTLDVTSVTGKLSDRVQSLMNQRIASAEDLTQIYDEDNNYRETLVREVLEEALRQALSQDAQTVTREVMIKLVKRDGSWWVVPDQALLQALSGVA